MTPGDVRGGGCQCGHVRYVADLREAEAYLCHCTMCRRATGAAAAALVGLPLTAVQWERELAWYRSSPIAERPFCAQCGTTLGFRFVEDATHMDLTLGSFDDPAGFAPFRNFAIESVLPAWQDSRDLPGVTTADNPGTARRWMKACGKLPN